VNILLYEIIYGVLENDAICRRDENSMCHLEAKATHPPPFVTIISTSGLTTFFRAGSLTGPLVAPNPALNDSGKLWAGSLGSWATQIAVKSHTGYKNEFIFIRKTQKIRKFLVFQIRP
jgi:hypothetical protein